MRIHRLPHSTAHDRPFGVQPRSTIATLPQEGEPSLRVVDRLRRLARRMLPRPA